MRIHYGRRTLPIKFERDSSVYVGDLKEAAGVKSKSGAIREAMLNPIGASRLSEIANGKSTVAIAISDFSRTTLDRHILPEVLRELTLGGIGVSKVTIIIGGGLHAKMKRPQIQSMIGPRMLGRTRLLQHDATRDLKFIGKSTFGNEIWINKVMAEADVKIALGDIVPHPYAGFSAGGKAVMPGLGGRETIIRNHLMVRPDLSMGQMENNPVREEIDESARMLGLDFIVNTVQNSEGGLVKVVAGDPIEAHREGVRVCADIYAVKVKRRPNVIVASAFPYDHDFYYASKPLENIRGILSEGSTVILISPCKGGIGSDDLEYFLSQPTSESIMDSIKQNPDRNLVTALVAYQVAWVRERACVFAYSEGLKPETLHKIGFRESENLQQTLDSAVSPYGDSCETLILPHAATCMPVLASG